MGDSGLTVTCPVHFKNGAKGRRRMRKGAAPIPRPVEPGRIPRISRLMALAIHFDGLLRRGEVKDYADLARLGHVSRARISQIMNLLNLAPGIQEEILFLPRTLKGRDPITERQFRPLVSQSDWRQQRRSWFELKS